MAVNPIRIFLIGCAMVFGALHFTLAQAGCLSLGVSGCGGVLLVPGSSSGVAISIGDTPSVFPRSSLAVVPATASGPVTTAPVTTLIPKIDQALAAARATQDGSARKPEDLDARFTGHLSVVSPSEVAAPELRPGVELGANTVVVEGGQVKLVRQ